MTNDLGGNTEDLNDLGHPHPTDRTTEDTLRQAGRRHGSIGLAIISLGVVGLLVCLIVSRSSINDPANEVLAITSGMICTATGAMFVGAFFAERGARYTRTLLRQVLSRADENDKRTGRIEHALDLIAEALPENNEVHRWRGFNDAVRDGFARQTGTDGAPQRVRSPHLGIVKRENNSET